MYTGNLDISGIIHDYRLIADSLGLSLLGKLTILNVRLTASYKKTSSK
jgi:hypothetical protein